MMRLLCCLGYIGWTVGHIGIGRVGIGGSAEQWGPAEQGSRLKKGVGSGGALRTALKMGCVNGAGLIVIESSTNGQAAFARVVVWNSAA